jgi:hypothetical protein
MLKKLNRKQIKEEFSTHFKPVAIELNAAILTITDSKEAKQTEMVLSVLEECFKEILGNARTTLNYKLEKL